MDLRRAAQRPPEQENRIETTCRLVVYDSGSALLYLCVCVCYMASTCFQLLGGSRRYTLLSIMSTPRVAAAAAAVATLLDLYIISEGAYIAGQECLNFLAIFCIF